MDYIYSKDVLKWIFSFLEEKVKLKIVFYSKVLKNKLDINKFNYQTISNKLLIIDEKGYGKIINKINEFIYFEGRFINGKKNGPGKEYYIISKEIPENKKTKDNTDNKFKIENITSEYYPNFKFKKDCTKGIINDKGKYYAYKILLKFEGEYKNDKRNGKGIEYYKDGKIFFEGEYLNNKRWNGRGFEYWKINDKDYKFFSGEYKNGDKFNGKIIIKCDWGRIEYGFKNGKENIRGKAYDVKGNLIFEGIFRDNKMITGIKKFYNSKGILVVEIEIRNGKIDGIRKEYNNKGNGNITFQGVYKNGKIWKGKGIKLSDDKKCIISGEYRDGQIFGKFLEYNFKGKLIFEGRYIKGYKYGNKYNGKGIIIFNGLQKNKKRWKGIGKIFYNNGNLKYEGQYNLGKRNGKGKEYYYYNKLIYEGDYYNGHKYNGIMLESGSKIINGCGFGKDYNLKGNVIFEGEYFKCKRWNGKGKIYNNKTKIMCDVEYKEGKIKNLKNKKPIKNIPKNYGFYMGRPPFHGEYFQGLNLKNKIKIYFIKKGEKKKILLFKGEYKKRGINGKGKEYDTNGNLIYKGIYKNGRWHGKGTQYTYFYCYKSYFKGEFENGKIKRGKEFQSDKLIYEGEFKDEKRHGFGKCYYYEGYPGSNKLQCDFDYGYFEGEFNYDFEYMGIMKFFYPDGKIGYISKYNDGDDYQEIKEFYYNGKLKFEGEYIYGKYFGKEYDQNGKILFEGQYNWTKKRWNGKGIEYDWNGDIIFEGEYRDGKRWNGKGKETFFNTYSNKKELEFEGEYINGIGEGIYKKYNEEGKIILEYIEKENKGIEYDYKGNKMFEGTYINQKRNGEGIEYNPKGQKMFKGEYLNGIRNGKGIEYDSKGRKIFEGIYINGIRYNGIEYEYKEKIQYETKYINGQKNNNIIMKEYFKNKLIFEGESLNWKRHGKGIEYYSDGKFVGIFKFGKKWNGIGYNNDGEIDYDIIDGYGKVKEYYKGKLIYEGEYLNGYRHGIGKEYDFLTGDLIYEGKFSYGKKLK